MAKPVSNKRNAQMTNSIINYIDRETSKRETEVVYGEKELYILYQTALGRALRRIFVTRPWFSELNALPKKIWFSKRSVRQFAERYQVNISEAEKPIDDYRTLDEFFTRKLRRGVRPVCTETHAFASPADGRVLAYKISSDLRLPVKNQRLYVRDLLGCQSGTEDLTGGTAVVVRLAPKDYHRFHFPVDGVAAGARVVSGGLESVHPIALNAAAPSFTNKRMVTLIDSRQFGPVYMVEVGALTVGTILQTYTPGPVKKGQEKGYFRFGGSTVILLWGNRGPVIDEDIARNSAQGLETLVKYGSRIAIAAKDWPDAEFDAAH